MRKLLLFKILCMLVVLSSCSNDDETITTADEDTKTVVTSSVIDLLTGGSTEPNQCYIDLSTGNQTAVRRDSWEIAVYNGAENKVFLNSSLLVSAAELNGVTDLLAVTENTTLVEELTLNSYGAPTTVTTIAELITNLPVSYAQYSNLDNDIVFTDSKEGDISGTAFSDISTTASENNVYILSLGNEIPTDAAEAGSINTTGDHRGFLKVRILIDGSNYTIRYAALNETVSYSELTITKDESKTLSAISLTNDTEVDVEPKTTEWDINFSGVFSYNSGGYGVTYSDYGLHNTLGNVGMYQVTIYEVDSDGITTSFDVPTYTDFSIDDVDDSAFVYDDRTLIGSGWRDYSLGIAKDDRYFVLKDNDGNMYKLRFTALLNSGGERGYSQFEYTKIDD